jgi:hypothetical protein
MAFALLKTITKPLLIKSDIRREHLDVDQFLNLGQSDAAGRTSPRRPLEKTAFTLGITMVNWWNICA